jgi:hypothetical protein
MLGEEKRKEKNKRVQLHNDVDKTPFMNIVAKKSLRQNSKTNQKLMISIFIDGKEKIADIIQA